MLLIPLISQWQNSCLNRDTGMTPNHPCAWSNVHQFTFQKHPVLLSRKMVQSTILFQWEEVHCVDCLISVVDIRLEENTKLVHDG